MDQLTSTSSSSPRLAPSPPMPTNKQEHSPGVEMFDRQTQLDDGDNYFSTVILWTRSARECWELALAEIANQAQPNNPISGSLRSSLAPNNLFDNEQPVMPPHYRNSNPFLDDDTAGLTGLELIPFPSAAAITTSQESFFPSEDILISVAPTFQAMAIAPTFNAQSPNQSPGSIEDDSDPYVLIELHPAGYRAKNECVRCIYRSSELAAGAAVVVAAPEKDHLEAHGVVN